MQIESSIRRRKKARIEIIPLIDIIFFLLATFVMVSLSMVQNNSISVQLPKAATGNTEDRSDTVIITVNANGDYLFNQEKLSLQDIQIRIGKLTKETSVFLNSDAKAEFQSVITLIDEVRKAGLSKLNIQTVPLP
ncbi:MAG: biopolymer transporter ExbD [bacterium]|nr:biopolymer transporter ExbD [bacterium]